MQIAHDGQTKVAHQSFVCLCHAHRMYFRSRSCASTHAYLGWTGECFHIIRTIMTMYKPSHGLSGLLGILDL